jgi:hypothetical protein
MTPVGRGSAICAKKRIISTSRVLAAVCRWTGSVIGTLLVVTSVIIAVGEGMPNPLTQPAWVQLMFFAMAPPGFLYALSTLLRRKVEKTPQHIAWDPMQAL